MKNTPNATELGIPTRAKSIRLKCLDCCAGSPNEVRHCTHTGCALWPYRLGGPPQNPKIQPTKEQLAKGEAEIIFT